MSGCAAGGSSYLLSSSTAFTSGSTSGGGLGGMTGTSEAALSAGELELADGAGLAVVAADAAAATSAELSPCCAVTFGGVATGRGGGAWRLGCSRGAADSPAESAGAEATDACAATGDVVGSEIVAAWAATEVPATGAGATGAGRTGVPETESAEAAVYTAVAVVG